MLRVEQLRGRRHYFHRKPLAQYRSHLEGLRLAAARQTPKRTVSELPVGQHSTVQTADREDMTDYPPHRAEMRKRCSRNRQVPKGILQKIWRSSGSRGWPINWFELVFGTDHHALLRHYSTKNPGCQANFPFFFAFFWCPRLKPWAVIVPPLRGLYGGEDG